MKKLVILTVSAVLGLAVVSMGLTTVAFSVGTHGSIDWTAANIVAFYKHGHCTSATLGWYLVSAAVVLVVFGVIKRLAGGWGKWILGTGMVALLMTPGLFLPPESTPFLGALLNASRHDLVSQVLPAWLCLARYWAVTTWGIDYLLYRALTMTITFWPIPLLWSGLSIVSLVTKRGRRFFFWPGDPFVSAARQTALSP